MYTFEIIWVQTFQNQEKSRFTYLENRNTTLLAKKPNWIVGNKFGNSRIKVQS